MLLFFVCRLFEFGGGRTESVIDVVRRFEDARESECYVRHEHKKKIMLRATNVSTLIFVCDDKITYIHLVDPFPTSCIGRRIDTKGVFLVVTTWHYCVHNIVRMYASVLCSFM